MTQIRLDDPTDEQTFKEGLAEFLQVAQRHDVPIERGWGCYVPSENGWEVEIVPLASDE